MTDTTWKRILRQISLFVLAAGTLTLLSPAAFADYAECLGGPRQTDTLRNPLVPGAPNSAPGQMPVGRPLTPGSGPVPNPVNPGDMGGPASVPSGYSDYTNGSIFPAGGSQGSKAPAPYVHGAGRYPTGKGQQKGLYDFGQGMSYGQGTYEHGGSNAGMPTYESGWGNGGKPTYDWGQGVAGSSTYESGMGNYGQQTYEGGGQSSGMTTYESGMGNYGQKRYENGGGSYGSRTYEGGYGNGGSKYYSGRSMGGGSKTYENGGSNGGNKFYDGGAGNGGSQTSDSGAGNGGARTTADPGARNGAQPTVNNGGPRSDAQQTEDTVNPAQVPGNNYDFQGPLPTVRTFCRYLVILGVVVACVWVSMSAISVVMGNNNGPARVVGAVAGLLLLLAGYTIWKIVQMNTFHGNTTGYSNNTRGMAQQRQYNGPASTTSGSTASDPGETSAVPGTSGNYQDPRFRQGPDNYRPVGPAVGHPVGPDRVGSYNIPSAGIVPEPPRMPVINPNK